MPPFEGFDETAHYSYVQQIAESGTLPRLNNPLSAEVSDYLRVAPSAVSLHARWSYQTFFAALSDVIDAGCTAAHAPRDQTWPWRASEQGENNWEAQHPPLYYIVLATILNLSNGWSLQTQLFLLLRQLLIYGAAYDNFSIGTWYLHSFAPIFAPVVGLGLAGVSRGRVSKRVISALMIYPLLFLSVAAATLALYFSGCGNRYPDLSTYDFPSAVACMSDVAGIYRNLQVVSDPQLAIGLFVVGWALMLIGLLFALRILVPKHDRELSKVENRRDAGGVDGGCGRLVVMLTMQIKEQRQT